MSLFQERRDGDADDADDAARPALAAQELQSVFAIGLNAPARMILGPKPLHGFGPDK